jgi:hypothetical protein
LIAIEVTQSKSAEFNSQGHHHVSRQARLSTRDSSMFGMPNIEE